LLIKARPPGGALVASRYSQLTGRPVLDARNVARVLEGEFPGVLRTAAAGDETAFARLWRDAHPVLLRYLRVMCADSAEDVAAETWLEIVRGLARFRGGELEFRGWMFTVARWRVADQRRYARRHPARPATDEDLDQPAADDTANAALESLSTKAALELIATLPPYQAEVITLRIVAGLDVEQVARITGRRPGTVRVAAHRGLRSLAARLSAAASRERGVTR
jgi:RNA polymerase sigma-70 factor, ECF subfamily